jgi:hypothetical protein
VIVIVCVRPRGRQLQPHPPVGVLAGEVAFSGPNGVQGIHVPIAYQGIEFRLRVNAGQ